MCRGLCLYFTSKASKPESQFIAQREQHTFKIALRQYLHTTLVQRVFKQHAGAEKRLFKPRAVERFGAQIKPARQQLRASLCDRLG